MCNANTPRCLPSTNTRYSASIGCWRACRGRCLLAHVHVAVMAWVNSHSHADSAQEVCCCMNISSAAAGACEIDVSCATSMAKMWVASCHSSLPCHGTVLLTATLRRILLWHVLMMCHDSACVCWLKTPVRSCHDVLVMQLNLYKKRDHPFCGVTGASTDGDWWLAQPGCLASCGRRGVVWPMCYARPICTGHCVGRCPC